MFYPSIKATAAVLIAALALGTAVNGATFCGRIKDSHRHIATGSAYALLTESKWAQTGYKLTGTLQYREWLGVRAPRQDMATLSLSDIFGPVPGRNASFEVAALGRSALPELAAGAGFARQGQVMTDAAPAAPGWAPVALAAGQGPGPLRANRAARTIPGISTPPTISSIQAVYAAADGSPTVLKSATVQSLAAVPVPASGALFLGSLLGLRFISRRKKA